MDELKSVKKKSVEIREEPNSEQNIKKEIDCINISKEDEKGEFVKIDIKQLKNIIYKCENCNAYIYPSRQFMNYLVLTNVYPIYFWIYFNKRRHSTFFQ